MIGNTMVNKTPYEKQMEHEAYDLEPTCIIPLRFVRYHLRMLRDHRTAPTILKPEAVEALGRNLQTALDIIRYHFEIAESILSRPLPKRKGVSSVLSRMRDDVLFMDDAINGLSEQIVNSPMCYYILKHMQHFLGVKRLSGRGAFRDLNIKQARELRDEMINTINRHLSRDDIGGHKRFDIAQFDRGENTVELVSLNTDKFTPASY